MATLNTVTSSTRPSSPAAGETYFETDTNKIIVWDGSAWTEIVSDGTAQMPRTPRVRIDPTRAASRTIAATSAGDLQQLETDFLADKSTTTNGNDLYLDVAFDSVGGRINDVTIVT